jgi:amino acid transporter
MTWQILVSHAFGFCAPALFLALLMPLLARLVVRKKGLPLSWWVQAVAHFIVGVAVLLAGVWWLGRDGRVLTYVGLVVMAGTTQWLLSRAWSR